MPEPPPQKQTRRLLFLGLLIPCLLISIPAVVAYLAERQLAESFHWVSHTIEVQHQIQRLLSLSLDAESGERGFLLSSREPYLDSYHFALKEIPRQIATLRALTSDSAVQRENLRQLDPLMTVRLDLLTQAVSLEQDGDHGAALKIIDADRGEHAMQAIRTRLALMDQEESRLLIKRQKDLASSASFSTAFLFGLVSLNFLFAFTMLVMFRRLSRAQNLITICAWSRTVEYQGEWLSFEEYLLRRFGLNTSHGISPSEAEKAFGTLEQK